MSAPLCVTILTHMLQLCCTYVVYEITVPQACQAINHAPVSRASRPIVIIRQIKLFVQFTIGIVSVLVVQSDTPSVCIEACYNNRISIVPLSRILLEIRSQQKKLLYLQYRKQYYSNPIMLNRTLSAFPQYECTRKDIIPESAFLMSTKIMAYSESKQFTTEP